MYCCFLSWLSFNSTNQIEAISPTVVLVRIDCEVPQYTARKENVLYLLARNSFCGDEGVGKLKKDRSSLLQSNRKMI